MGDVLHTAHNDAMDDHIYVYIMCVEYLEEKDMDLHAHRVICQFPFHSGIEREGSVSCAVLYACHQK